MRNLNIIGRKYLFRILYCTLPLLLFSNVILLIQNGWKSNLFLLWLIATMITIILFILTFKRQNPARKILGIILLIFGGYGFFKGGIILVDLISLFELVLNFTFLTSGIVLLTSPDIDCYMKSKPENRGNIS